LEHELTIDCPRPGADLAPCDFDLFGSVNESVVRRSLTKPIAQAAHERLIQQSGASSEAENDRSGVKTRQ
jgi:hypothetical protein